MVRPRLTLVLGAIVLFLLLAGCGPQVAANHVLRIGLHAGQKDLPYFAMQSRGFGKQNGLQFLETSLPDGPSIIQGFGDDSYDVAYVPTVSIFQAAGRGLVPIKAISVGVNDVSDPYHPSVGVVAAPSVRNWKDLEGQYIAVGPAGSLSDAGVKGRFQHEGVNAYTPVEIPFVHMGLAVQGGTVAAAALPEPFLSQSLLRGDGRLLGWIAGGPPFENMELSWITVDSDFQKNNPLLVKAFLRAHLQSVRWIDQHPDEARSLLARRLDISQEVGKRVKLPRWPLDARHQPALMESMQTDFFDAGVVHALVSLDQLYDETLLNDVLEERR